MNPVLASFKEPAVPALNLGDTDRLLALARENHVAYANAKPYPHIVLDGVFPGEVLTAALEEFKQITAHTGNRNFFGAERKGYTIDPWLMGPAMRRFMLDLNSGKFCEFLEILTGIPGVLPDPHYGGGGVHEISRGGFLKVHADFNWHQRIGLDRRINVLIYLNPGWKEEWGGHLELWDTKMKGRVVKVSPEFGRMVVFSTTDDSFHGHPDPLECPEDVTRRSFAFYYYTNGRPAGEVRGRRSGTRYEARPGEKLQQGSRERLRSLVRKLLGKGA
jgi:hypothetical protein